MTRPWRPTARGLRRRNVTAPSRSSMVGSCVMATDSVDANVRAFRNPDSFIQTRRRAKSGLPLPKLGQRGPEVPVRLAGHFFVSRTMLSFSKIGSRWLEDRLEDRGTVAEGHGRTEQTTPKRVSCGDFGARNDFDVSVLEAGLDERLQIPQASSNESAPRLCRIR